VARDRQRAKQKRRESRTSEPGDSPRDVARRTGLDDGTPAPDPLKGALPDVEQARLAETGAALGREDEEVDDPGYGRDYQPAPDEIEGDQPVRTRDLDPSVREETVDRGRRKSRPRVIAFLGHCIDELRRVQWPDRKQVGQATAVVLGFVVLAGGYLGLMDAIFKPLVQAIL
jgi:preprotein translocase SecE subunit